MRVSLLIMFMLMLVGTSRAQYTYVLNVKRKMNSPGSMSQRDWSSRTVKFLNPLAFMRYQLAFW